MRVMRTSSLTLAKNQTPKQDPHYLSAVQRAQEAARRLRDAGILDAAGQRIRKDLPPDMKDGQERDFGG